jgi:predicted dehydrogenase
VAVIGTGGSVGNHLTAIREMGQRVELTAAVDIDSARVQAISEEHGIPKWYTDTGKMLAAEQPDLVHIVTPPATHKDLIIECLEANTSVYCEKPLCISLAEYDEIAEAEARTGGTVSTVFQWRFGSAITHLRQLIQSDELGKALVGVCNTLWYRMDGYYQNEWRGRWESEGGGPSMTLGIHLMDLFLWLMGDWAEVQAMIDTVERPIEVEDVSMALVRFESGAMGSIVNSVLSPRQESYMRLDFQRATVEVSTLYRYSNRHWKFSIPEGAAHTDDLERWRSIPVDVPGRHEAQLALILDAMDRGEAPPLNGAEGRRTLEFLASLYKSAFTQQPVKRGSISPDDPWYYAMNGDARKVSSV